MSVLQALLYIKDDLDGTLSFRWSCRMAICGSCGMMIDGVPKLACRTFLRNYASGKVRIEPLAHFPIERDLMVRVADYVKRLEGIKPYLIPKEGCSLEQGEYLQTPQQMDRYNQFSACINCMLCYAACPQYGMNPKFIGSGHMALLHRYNADSRDGGQEARMEPVNQADGVWGCTAIGYCSVVCPKQVDPANAINMYKIKSTADYFIKFMAPRGTGK
jgi:fumarate reductase iron-sulfur subunit